MLSLRIPLPWITHLASTRRLALTLPLFLSHDSPSPTQGLSPRPVPRQTGPLHFSLHPGPQVNLPPARLFKTAQAACTARYPASRVHCRSCPLRGRVRVAQSSALFPLSHWLLLPDSAGEGGASGARPAPCPRPGRGAGPWADSAPSGRGGAGLHSGAGRRCLGSSRLRPRPQLLWG